MRILLDESAPKQLRRLLPQHEVSTVPERGWASKRNGELLTLAEADGFDVFATPDRSLAYQQNLATFNIAVVVLAAGRNRMATYERLADELVRTVAGARRGAASWFTG